MTFICQDESIIIDVYVQPGARISQACGSHDGRLKIKINSPPIDGKANQEVLSFFVKILGLSKRDVVLMTGDKSRNKRIRLTGDVTQISKILQGLYDE